MFTTAFFTEDHKMAGLRHKLITALKAKGINSAEVLDAMMAVPRQLFFPMDFEQFVYRDAAFPIGHGQTISQPFTVAFQTQLLQIKPNDKVLEIGTGSGYQAAILSAMGARVYSIELVKELLLESGKVLKNIDSEINLYHGDGTLGLPAEAPFDAILITAGAPDIPATYINQLKIGGRLVIPVGEKIEEQEMMRITKISEFETRTESFGNFKFVPLKGQNGWK